MGYFPLPELKGKPNRIFVDGKTLNQIAKESGIRLDTVQHRYSRGIRDYEGLTKPSHIRVEHEKTQRKTYSIMSAGERVMERIWELDIPLQTISDKTGISRSTIYAFLYNGTDLSSMRLVAPLVGAWIAITLLKVYVRQHLSLLSWERGLKLLKVDIFNTENVAPLVGAWIEI